jgi:uncharacterized protein (TIGR00369 family)
MTIDAFDPSHTRTRTLDWQDPVATRAQGAGRSGLEIMRAMRDGELPPPPMARLLGFDCVTAEDGEIVMALVPGPSLENTSGLLHGGVAATLLDTAMGAAAHTVCPPGSMTVTQDLTITYLRKLTLASGTIRATGRVLNRGRKTIYVTGEVHDGAGALAAHAVGNFAVLTPGAPRTAS